MACILSPRSAARAVFSRVATAHKCMHTWNKHSRSFLSSTINTQSRLLIIGSFVASQEHASLTAVVRVSLSLSLSVECRFFLCRSLHEKQFLVTRSMEDFVTWVDGSKIKRAIKTYEDKVDDFDLLGEG